MRGGRVTAALRTAIACALLAAGAGALAQGALAQGAASEPPAPAAPAPAPAPDVPAVREVQVRILVTGGRRGELENGVRTSLAWQVAALRTLRAEAEAAGIPVIALDSGETLFPGLISRTDEGRTMLDALERAGTDYLAPGLRDLDHGVGPLRAATARGGVSSISSCLVSRADAKALFPGHAVRTLGPLRVAFIGVGRQDLVRLSAAQAAQVARMRPVAEAARAEVEGITRNGEADLIVCFGDVSRAEAREIARAAPAVGVILGRADPEVEAYRSTDVHLGAPRAGALSALLAAPLADGRAVCIVDLWARPAARSDGGGWRLTRGRVSHLSPDDRLLEPDAETAARVLALREAYDRDRSRTLLPDVAAVFPDGFSRDALIELATAALREKTSAEVAILSRSLISERVSAAVAERGELRASDLPLLVQADEVAWVDVLGAQLRALFEADERRGRLIFVGLARTAAGVITVNGRPLDPKEVYEVATHDVLASGQSGMPQLLPPQRRYDRFHMAPDLEIDAADDDEGDRIQLGSFLRELIRREVAAIPDGPDPKSRGRATIERYRQSARTHPPLWLLRLDNLRVTFQSARAKQNADFAAVRDKRANADNQELFTGAGAVELARVTGDTQVTGSVTARFTRIDVEGEDARTASDDLRFRIELTPVFFAFPTFVDDLRLAPFGSAELDTEFERPRESGAHRQKELFLTLGVRNPQPGFWFERFQVGAFASYNFTDPDDDNWNGGVEFDMSHRQTLFGEVDLAARVRGRSFLLNTTPDDGDLLWFAEPSLIVTLPFFFNLRFAVDTNAYVFRERGVSSVGYYYSVAIGLSYARAFKL